jgi:hypothetical protein
MISTRITDAGLELLKAIDAPLLALHQKQLGHLGAQKLDDLLTLLEEVRGRCTNE